MRYLKLTAVLSCCGILCACGSQGGVYEHPAGDSTAIPTVEATIEHTDRTTVETTSAPAETTSVLTQSAVTSITTAETVSDTVTTLSSVTIPPTTGMQGGQGGEAHADEPEPLYFNYRFAPDCVTMRLAGGNYQTIFYDFEAAVEHDVDSLYYLDDFDFDGSNDLAVPVIFADSNITYAIFLWNKETMFYEEEPILLCNPSAIAESRQVVSLTSDGTEASVLRFFIWDTGTLSETVMAAADYTACTLTVTYPGGDSPETVTEYDSTEALNEAMQAMIAPEPLE